MKILKWAVILIMTSLLLYGGIQIGHKAYGLIVAPVVSLFGNSLKRPLPPTETSTLEVIVPTVGRTQSSLFSNEKLQIAGVVVILTILLYVLYRNRARASIVYIKGRIKEVWIPTILWIVILGMVHYKLHPLWEWLWTDQPLFWLTQIVACVLIFQNHKKVKEVFIWILGIGLGLIMIWSYASPNVSGIAGWVDAYKLYLIAFALCALVAFKSTRGAGTALALLLVGGYVIVSIMTNKQAVASANPQGLQRGATEEIVTLVNNQWHTVVGKPGFRTLCDPVNEGDRIWCKHDNNEAFLYTKGEVSRIGVNTIFRWSSAEDHPVKVVITQSPSPNSL